MLPPLRLKIIQGDASIPGLVGIEDGSYTHAALPKPAGEWPVGSNSDLDSVNLFDTAAFEVRRHTHAVLIGVMGDTPDIEVGAIEGAKCMFDIAGVHPRGFCVAAVGESKNGNRGSDSGNAIHGVSFHLLGTVACLAGIVGVTDWSWRLKRSQSIGKQLNFNYKLFSLGAFCSPLSRRCTVVSKLPAKYGGYSVAVICDFAFEP
ncbi:hypothetical protein [Rhizobium sp. Root1220]|uniref:hypothetical protein n=1 Tax=Rhizobium sp. Root1220 TaxID=1736432 RepID=UPI0012E36025|nr:hypothetical protein [Rhizobium sp. Root1220]